MIEDCNLQNTYRKIKVALYMRNQQTSISILILTSMIKVNFVPMILYLLYFILLKVKYRTLEGQPSMLATVMNAES